MKYSTFYFSTILSSLLVITGHSLTTPRVTLPSWTATSSMLSASVSVTDKEFSGFGVTWDWEQVTAQVFQDDKRPIILFDGVCNLCNGGVNFALDHDAKATFRFVSLQSKVGQSLLIRSGRNPSDISSIVLCLDDGRSYFKSDAILKIAQGLDGPLLPLFGTLGLAVTPKFVRNAVYKVVSENRYQFGEYKNDQCRLDLDGELDSRFIQDPVV